MSEEPPTVIPFSDANSALQSILEQRVQSNPFPAVCGGGRQPGRGPWPDPSKRGGSFCYMRGDAPPASGTRGGAWSLLSPVTEVPSTVRGAPTLAPPTPRPSSPAEPAPWGRSAAHALSFSSFSEGPSDPGVWVMGLDAPAAALCGRPADTHTPTARTTTQTKVHCEPPFGLLLVGALKLQC
uniref:Uncharacterized protein n=1 Tax=Prolemur simus TaxID=1328070 RepID=A0A8C8YMW0_PROSS